MEQKKYYFVIGEKNLMVAEAIKLLTEYQLPFKCLEMPYIFTKDEEDELLAQGFVPYYVGVAYRNNCSYDKISDAFLYQLLMMLDKPINDWQSAVLTYCCGNFASSWKLNLHDLIMSGQQRKDIERLQEENRRALGFDEQAELSAQQAVDEAMLKANKQENYLIIAWKYKAKYIDFEAFMPVLDRVFWRQRWINVVVFAENGAFYYGYNKIAEALLRKWKYTGFAAGCQSGALYAQDEEHKALIAEVLAAETAKLKDEGLLW